MEKPCTRCGRTRPAADFYANKRTKDGLQSWCKACTKDKTKLSSPPPKERRSTKYMPSLDRALRLYLELNRCALCRATRADDLWVYDYAEYHRLCPSDKETPTSMLANLQLGVVLCAPCRDGLATGEKRLLLAHWSDAVVESRWNEALYRSYQRT